MRVEWSAAKAIANLARHTACAPRLVLVFLTTRSRSLSRIVPRAARCDGVEWVLWSVTCFWWVLTPFGMMRMATRNCPYHPGKANRQCESAVRIGKAGRQGEHSEEREGTMHKTVRHEFESGNLPPLTAE